MQRNLNLKNRMREIRSSGTVGVRGGNEPLYPEKEKNHMCLRTCTGYNNNNILKFFLILSSGQGPFQYLVICTRLA